MADLDGRVAVVTGAARGIGLGIAERLSAAGASVLVTDIDGVVGLLPENDAIGWPARMVAPSFGRALGPPFLLCGWHISKERVQTIFSRGPNWTGDLKDHDMGCGRFFIAVQTLARTSRPPRRTMPTTICALQADNRIWQTEARQGAGAERDANGAMQS
jgi:hypothetical protein